MPVTNAIERVGLGFVRLEFQLLRQVFVHDVGEPVSAERFLFGLFPDFPEGVDLSLPESSSITGILLKLVQSLQIQIRQGVARQLIVYDICGPDSAPDRVGSIQLSKMRRVCGPGDYDHGDVHSPRVTIGEYVDRQVPPRVPSSLKKSRFYGAPALRMNKDPLERPVAH